GRVALFVGANSLAWRGISGHESAVTAINATGRSARHNLDAVGRLSAWPMNSPLQVRAGLGYGAICRSSVEPEAPSSERVRLTAFSRRSRWCAGYRDCRGRRLALPRP